MKVATYTRPVSFGPALGPRQAIHNSKATRFNQDLYEQGSTDLYSVYIKSSKQYLSKLLPPGFEVDDRVEPHFKIEPMLLNKLPWLAGRSYKTIGFLIPTVYRGKETVRGYYEAILFENLHEPILTGREELGVAKVFSDITVEESDDKTTFTMSWDGCKWFEMTVKDLQPTTSPHIFGAPLQQDGVLHYKYIPRTGEWGKADVEYATLFPAPKSPPTVRNMLKGTASYEITRGSFDQLPTLHTIVNGLADIPNQACLGAVYQDIQGVSDLFNARIVM